MKYIILLGILILFAHAEIKQEEINENTENTTEPTLIKDTSGLTDEEIRKIATQKDEKEKKANVKTKDIIKTIIDSNYKDNIDISKLQTPWEKLSPTPKKYDWVQTKSGEWFKGYIKALYDDELEFDSDEIGLYVFDFDDVIQIKSYQILTVNIEDVAIIKGIVRFKDNTITIIQGNTKYDFRKNQIVSLASEGEKEGDMWSGKITLSMDRRTGNTKSFDYTAKVNAKRQTAKTKLQLDYLGRIASKNDIETANDHLINEKFNIYINRRFFWIPLSSEFYQNTYKNIQARYRAGAGLGYVFLDNNTVQWDISGGPAYLSTEYVSVEQSDSSIASSIALELSTNLDLEINSKMDLKYNYLLTWSNDTTGAYSHHMILTLENEITSWLDLDISGIWDYTLMPRKKSDGEIPLKDDFQILIGLGIEF